MIDESKMTLAVDFRGQTDLIGWYATEKLNGCRAYWDGKRFWSRDGKIIKAPSWLTDQLHKVPLDGEIHAGRGTGYGNNNSAYKIAMTAVVQGGKWWDKLGDDGLPIRFTVFDYPLPTNPDMNWETRMAGVKIAIPFEKILNSRHLAEYMIDLKQKGAEGAMFRNPDEVGYHAGRTGALLRWKFLE